MPIVDYKHVAQVAEAQFFSDDNVSEKNKKLIRKFLEIYDVSPARKAIFLKHIRLLLYKTNDVSKDMHRKDKINRIFKELRDSIGISYYCTVLNVSIRLAIWLNGGSKPDGFKEIPNIKKSRQKRKLSPDDMITWDDGIRLIESTNNLMLKAMIATQLDGGFRPSEFVDLNYGDASVKKEFVLMGVKDGKTGARPVILWRCVPYLLKWLQSHPTKRKADPLWLQEGNTHGQVIRYQYRAMQKRIQLLANKIKLDKPVDFYNMRHSACTLSKMDNVPEEIAAAKFGHSIEYYTNTYGRLSTENVLERFSNHYGITREHKNIEKPQACSRCDFINVPEASICEKCGAALSLKDALENEKESSDLKNEVKGLKDQLNNINSIMNSLLAARPDAIERLARDISKAKISNTN